MQHFGNCKLAKHANRPDCLEGIPHDTPLADVEHWLRDYTVFTMVRNPYTRAASGYTYLTGPVRSQHIPSTFFQSPGCKVDWEDYCVNPRILAHHCRAFPQCCGDMNLKILMMHTDP